MIRVATLADAEVVAGLERAAARDPWSVEAVRSSLAAATTRARLVGDPPVGHVLYTVVADEGEVLTIGVTPASRRLGHARRLLDAVHQDWRAGGVATGWLEVRADNAGARALYAANGWSEVGVRRAYYADGTDAVVCRWSP